MKKIMFILTALTRIDAFSHTLLIFSAMDLSRSICLLRKSAVTNFEIIRANVCENNWFANASRNCDEVPTKPFTSLF